MIRRRVTAEMALLTMFKTIILIAFLFLFCQGKINSCNHIVNRTVSVRWAKIICNLLSKVTTLILFTHYKIYSVQSCACLTARLSELIVNQFYNTIHIYLHLLNATKTLFYLVKLVFIIYPLFSYLSLTPHNLKLIFSFINMIYTIYTFIIIIPYLPIEFNLLFIIYKVKIESALMMILTSFMTGFVACYYSDGD